jgi:hypothetical protein
MQKEALVNALYTLRRMIEGGLAPWGRFPRIKGNCISSADTAS